MCARVRRGALLHRAFLRNSNEAARIGKDGNAAAAV